MGQNSAFTCKNWHKDLLRFMLSKKLWCHKHFMTSLLLVNANLNKSSCPFLHLNALYPLDFVSSKKDVSCLSFRSFCFQVMWLTKCGHDYQKWWQPQIEETWPKTNPRIWGELKIWWLEVIYSIKFELFCSYRQLSPCGHPAIMDARYYGQNSDPHL